MTITLQLNGKPVLSTASSITALLNEHSINPSHVVVEVNGVIIPKEEFNHRLIDNNDSIEILRFVGGG